MKVTKCIKCGAELKAGCIYCSVCGQDVQIVSDDALLEEELLQELLQEKQQGQAGTGSASRPAEGSRESGENRTAGGKYTSSGKTATDEKNVSGGNSMAHGKSKSGKKKNHRTLIIVCICLVVLIIATVTITLVIRNKNNNSYDYQMQKAQEAQQEKDYTRAISYYKRALELNEKDVDARLELAEVHLAMEEQGKAISVLHDVIALDAQNLTAFQQLITLYDSREDYDSILALQQDAQEEEVLELFEAYQVTPPEFTMEPGTYQDTLEITMDAQSGCQIYYTTDGSDPIEKGELYEEAIPLSEQGSLTVRAVCCSQYGIYSSVIQGTFTVRFVKPALPRATPDSGNFSMPATVTLSTRAEGGKIYYTWDGSDPTVNSTQYIGPIEVPEGNNILSAIVVDEHEMISDVLKCNYIYLP